TFAEAVTRCNAPSDRPWWSQMVFPLERPLAVRDGDVVEIDIAMNQVDDAGQSWSWTTRTRSAGSIAVAECRQSTSPRTSTAPATINDSRSVYALASEALGLFDGRRTVGDIAASLHTVHPTAFLN